MSPWGHPDKSFDNTTEILGTTSSKEDAKSAKDGKTTIDPKIDRREEDAIENRLNSGNVKILNTNRSSEEKEKALKQSKNINKDLPSRKEKSVLPAPFLSSSRLNPVPEGVA